MKLWRIAGVLFLIGAEALLYGYSYPFFSLALEKRELANWLIGFNASIAGAGILFVGPFLPRAIDRLGINRLVALLFAVSFASFGAILLVNHVVVWFAARFLMGTCFSALWTTTEIWLNGTVDDRHRGRIIGGSGTLYAICQFVAPLVLGVTGVAGNLPLIVAMVPLAFGAVVALLVPPLAAGEAEGHDETPHESNLKSAIALAGPILIVSFLSGVGETAMQSLLPLYGLAHGLTDAGAARLVAVFSLGEAFLVLVLGWMADRLGRGFTLKVAGIVATTTVALLPFAIGQPLFLNPILFFAGGAISGIYALGVILIGQDFRGQRLAAVSTGFGMAYSAGSIVGSTPVGLAIDLLGPQALPVTIAASFFGLTVYLFLRDRRKDEASEAPIAGDAVVGLEPLFPLDLTLDENEAIDVEQAEIRDLQMRDDRQRQESDLKERFRQRAAEIARRGAERHQARTDELERLQTHQPGKR